MKIGSTCTNETGTSYSGTKPEMFQWRGDIQRLRIRRRPQVFTRLVRWFLMYRFSLNSFLFFHFFLKIVFTRHKREHNWQPSFTFIIWGMVTHFFRTNTNWVTCYVLPSYCLLFILRVKSRVYPPLTIFTFLSI